MNTELLGLLATISSRSAGRCLGMAGLLVFRLAGVDILYGDARTRVVMEMSIKDSKETDPEPKGEWRVR